jgi:hypothetical protein
LGAALFALNPPTAAFGLTFAAGLCCAFGGVPTIEGGVVSSGVVC